MILPTSDALSRSASGTESSFSSSTIVFLYRATIASTVCDIASGGAFFASLEASLGCGRRRDVRSSGWLLAGGGEQSGDEGNGASSQTLPPQNRKEGQIEYIQVDGSCRRQAEIVRVEFVLAAGALHPCGVRAKAVEFGGSVVNIPQRNGTLRIVNNGAEAFAAGLH